MPITQKKYPILVDPRRAQVGEPAVRYSHALAMTQSFLHERNWRGIEYVAGYIGRPDTKVNGNGASQFHIITGSPVKADTGDPTRKLHFRLENWRTTDFGAASESNTWYDTIGGASVSLTTAAKVAGTSDAWVDGANGNKYDYLVNYTPVGTGVDDGFKLHRLDATNQLVKTLAAWEEPEAGTVSSSEGIVSMTNFGVNQPINGYDVSASDPGTMGAIAYYQQTGDSVMHNTRRCIHQICYAMSAYTEATSWTHVRQDGDGNPYNQLIKPRWLNGEERICEIALCATIVVPEAGDAGIRISSVTAGDVWTYTTSSTLATPTLITTSDGTSTDNGAGGGLSVAVSDDNEFSDSFTLEAYADAGGSVKIHTVSLWEPHSLEP